MRRTFHLVHAEARQRALAAVREAPDGYSVTVAEPSRNLDQNAHFHAICADLARAKAQWFGKARTAAEWKVLLVSGHAVATKERADIVPGIEGEMVNIRESTALMSKARGSSLIEYAQSFASQRTTAA